MRSFSSTLRPLGCVIFLSALIVGCNARPRTDDSKVGVQAAAYAKPNAVVSGATATAKLAAWLDYHNLPSAGTPQPKSTWLWHITAVEYSPDGNAFGKPTADRLPSVALSEPDSTNTDLDLRAASGYWRITCNASLSRIDAAGQTSTGTSRDVAITFIVVDATIRVWNDSLNRGQGDWGQSTEIAAGAIDSQAHQTDVFISVSPAVAAEVPLTLHGGAGHPADAKLQIGGKVAGPDQTVAVRTDATGHLIGVLTSSDTTGGKPVTITGGGGRAAVTFAWDNYQAKDKWERPELIAGETGSLTVKFAHNGRPLAGHKILFVVSKVEYTDANGKPQTLINTPEHPQDLADWAAFDEPDDPTDGTGTIFSKVHYQQKCASATNVELAVYDMTVFDMTAFQP